MIATSVQYRFTFGRSKASNSGVGKTTTKDSGKDRPRQSGMDLDHLFFCVEKNVFCKEEDAKIKIKIAPLFLFAIKSWEKNLLRKKKKSYYV